MADKGNFGGGDARYDFLQRFFHDLATPLSAVSLHLEGADRKIKRGADPTESLAIARSELSRAFQLFEWGRECLFASAGRAETFGFDDFVASTIQQNGGAGVSIEGLTGGRVAGDRRQLSEALLALVANARQAAGSESISMRLERGGGRLRVFVENPGRLPAAAAETSASSGSSAGERNWGMSLARARLQVAAAGGTIRLEQQPNRIRAILELPEETA